MNSAIEDEVTSINAIYGSDVLSKATHEESVFILKVPSRSISLQIAFPEQYPELAPSIIGPDSVGSEWRKGEANDIVEIAVTLISILFKPGKPCIYDLIEELQEKLRSNPVSSPNNVDNEKKEEAQFTSGLQASQHAEILEPPWIVSEVVTEKKSLFIARAAAVSSATEAKQFVDHLIRHDKKVAKATHNITAWRIRSSQSPDITFQDCDDDGETAAGGRLLHLLQLMQAWNVMVVVTRWYGGIHLGPDRFRLINSVARDALVRGGFVKQEVEKPNKK